MGYSIINPALSLVMKRLVIGQRQKAPDFSALHLSPHGSLVFIDHVGSTFTEMDRNKFNYRIRPKHRIGPGCAGRAKLIVTLVDSDTHKPRRRKPSSSSKVIYVVFIPIMFELVKLICMFHNVNITFPSEKFRPETWPGKAVSKATPVRQLTSSYRCHRLTHTNPVCGQQAHHKR